MKYYATAAAIMLAASLTACQKKADDTAAAPAPQPVPAAAPAPVETPPAELTSEQRKLAEKKAALDYGVMEDKYLNDPRAQWATEAKASSVFGDTNGATPSESNLPDKATGPSDDRQWTNSNIDKGFDWLQLGYATPVNATELRFVISGGQGVEAINKVELQDTDDKWHTVWEGLSDAKRDTRGTRTWFVRSFEKTSYKAKGAKITFANNLQHDYKVIDAVQLVGDK
ncbi:hypothetical protein ACXZ1M_08170 [Duganella sp. PWIR1]